MTRQVTTRKIYVATQAVIVQPSMIQRLNLVKPLLSESVKSPSGLGTSLAGAPMTVAGDGAVEGSVDGMTSGSGGSVGN